LSERNGTRTGGGREVTISDVAEAASVSVRTVSRVLNGSPLVNAATRENVQAVIERLAFSPSLRARALAVGRSYLIGMIHDEPNVLSLGAVQKGFGEGCAAEGYELVVHAAKHRHGSPEIVEEIVRFARRSRVDGLVLLPPISESPAIPAALAELKVPVTGFAAVRVPGYTAMLVSDERRGGRLMAEHLLELGHRRIAMITGPRDRHSATERAHGFRAALRDAGVSLPSELVREGDYGFESGVREASVLLQRPDRPSALFAGNDIMAAGALKAAAQMGIRVPEALSVAGFDGSSIAEMVSPALTTVHRPLVSMARDAAELLLSMIKDEAAMDWSADLSTSLSLIRRESTGPAPDRPPGRA